MYDLSLRVYRTLCERDLDQFLADATVEMADQILRPRIEPWFGNRLLEKSDLAEVCESSGTFFDNYDSAESHTFDLPTTPGGYSQTERDRMTNTYSGMHIDAPYVCEVPDVSLIGPDAVAVHSNKYIFENSLESTRRLALSSLLSLAEGTLPVYSGRSRADQEFDCIISLVGPWAGNYTHWFQDYLTRLEGLEHYRSKTDTDPMVLIPADASGWMRDALRAVGYSSDEWIEWEGGRASVDRLIVSSVRREARERAKGENRRILYSPTGIKWVRNRILNSITPEQTVAHSPRVYLSRSNMNTRRVRNKNEVITLLSDWGFERYHPEELTFAEQVTLFSNAEAIVSPHGSGLMNQIFADDAVVIELMGKKKTITTPATEYHYAEGLGHNYACVPGEAIGPDLRSDVSGLATVLEKLLEK